jgi:hypothetical protein
MKVVRVQDIVKAHKSVVPYENWRARIRGNET